MKTVFIHIYIVVLSRTISIETASNKGVLLMEYGKTRSSLAEWRADCGGYDEKPILRTYNIAWRIPQDVTERHNGMTTVENAEERYEYAR